MSTTLPVPPAQEPLQVPPLTDQRSLLISEDIRHFLWDRTIADNPLDVDLAFSDGEIAAARRYAVSMYNSVQPYSIRASMDTQTNDYHWLYSISYHLFLGRMMVLTRSDMDYSAGGMSADITTKRIGHLTKWLEMFKAEGERLIGEQKYAANVNSYFAYY